MKTNYLAFVFLIALTIFSCQLSNSEKSAQSKAGMESLHENTDAFKVMYGN